MKKVSLVFPVYNVERVVRESLLSALNQTYGAVEYIIVDDRGSDNSMAVVRETLNAHPRRDAVKVVTHEVNKGLGATRNTGIREASGDYIMFMDSDDFLHEDAVEVLVNSADEGCDMVVGSYQRVVSSDGGEVKNVFRTGDETVEGRDAIVGAYFRDRKWTEQCWGKIFRTGFLRDNNLYCLENCNNEDTPFMFQCCLRLKKVRLVSDIIYDWIEREGSITSRIREKNLVDWYNGFVYMSTLAQGEKGRPWYITLVGYLNNFRLNRIWLLLKNKVAVEKGRREEMMREFAEPLLSACEIVHCEMSVYDRLKHSIFLLPQGIRFLLLKLISATQKA